MLATAEKTKAPVKKKTQYTLLGKQPDTPDGMWEEISGSFEGYTPKQGIAAAAKTWDQNAPEWVEVVAIPTRQWAPRKVSVDTSVRVKLT